MRNSRFKIQHNESSSHSYWMSYSDLMAGLLLVFILFLTLSVLDYRKDLNEKESILKAKEMDIEEYKDALAEKESRIQEILGVKADIIKALTLEFQDSQINMEIDPQTGAIRFQGGVFFSVDDVKVSSGGYEMLNNFFPQYIDILLSPSYKEYIAQIIVEGHTDDVGSYIYNLDLSQKRAYSVVEAIFSDRVSDFVNKNKLEYYITSNGRSFSQPVSVNGEYSRDASRRVEFKFRLKEDEMIQELEKLVKVND